MTSLAETLKRVTKRLDTDKWVRCPLCAEEWNQLRPCSYTDGAEAVGTYVCVTCAESIQSVQRVLDLLKVDAFVYRPERIQPYKDLYFRYKEKFDNPRAFTCRIENAIPIVNIWLESDGARIILKHVEAQATVRFDNIFQAVSYFKHLVNEAKKKPAPKSDGGWR